MLVIEPSNVPLIDLITENIDRNGTNATSPAFANTDSEELNDVDCSLASPSDLPKPPIKSNSGETVCAKSLNDRIELASSSSNFVCMIIPNCSN